MPRAENYEVGEFLPNRFGGDGVTDGQGRQTANNNIPYFFQKASG